jgi:ribosomal protein S18 acetylase RimI-like enzyme
MDGDGLKTEKVKLKDLKASEVFELTSKRFQEKIDTLYDSSDEFYIFKDSKIECGFFYLAQTAKNMNVRLFVREIEFNLLELKNILNDTLKDYNFHYLLISLYKNSKNVLHQFDRIDSSLKYERNSDNYLLEIDFNSQFIIEYNVTDYSELIHFFEEVFANDEEYCRTNWHSMTDTFKKMEFPKIEIILKDNDKIIGALIGLKIDASQKFYLHTIGVHPFFQGKKIGKQLMIEFLKKTENFPTYLNVLESAHIARKLYEILGFELQEITSIYCEKGKL